MNKILVLSDHPTHPVIGGNRMCIMQYVEMLQMMGYEVHLLYVHNVNSSIESRNKTADFWKERFHEFKVSLIQYYTQRLATRFKRSRNELCLDLLYPWGLTSYIEKLQNKYHFIGLISNYIWMSKSMFSSIPRKVLFTHDVFSNRNLRVNDAEWYSFTVTDEQKALNRCPLIFSIQDTESVFFRYLSPKSKVVTVYSSFAKCEHSILGNKNILFFSGGQKLNRNALFYFMNEVLPLLVSLDNSIKLVVGGSICREIEHEELHPNVILRGFYDNPADFYEEGDIVINPVSEGTGLKIKTIEAVAHGKVTVVDKHSLIGVYEPNLFPVLVANSADEYVSSIMKYIGNKEKISEMKNKDFEYLDMLNSYIMEQYSNAFSI